MVQKKKKDWGYEIFNETLKSCREKGSMDKDDIERIRKYRRLMGKKLENRPEPPLPDSILNAIEELREIYTNEEIIKKLFSEEQVERIKQNKIDEAREKKRRTWTIVKKKK